MRTGSVHHGRHSLRAHPGVDIDTINYATKYTTKMKAKFPTVTKSSLMNLHLNQKHQNSRISLKTARYANDSLTGEVTGTTPKKFSKKMNNFKKRVVSTTFYVMKWKRQASSISD